MISVITAANYEFPYTQLKFPGQASDEKILYVTREAPVMLWMRLTGVAIVAMAVLGIALVSPFVMSQVLGQAAFWFSLLGLVLSASFGVVGGWWVYLMWRRSVFIITTRRLTKFIYTTPFNRHNLSVDLENIVDTGAYTKGYWEVLAGIGTFTARSSAGNREQKYFYITNVTRAEDLANYVNKLLHAYRKSFDRIDSFRPFMPGLKGERRKQFMLKFPEYWS